jgi:uncharacterized membrane protein
MARHRLGLMEVVLVWIMVVAGVVVGLCMQH